MQERGNPLSVIGNLSLGLYLLQVDGQESFNQGMVLDQGLLQMRNLGTQQRSGLAMLVE
jgi:hypothetical protein